ncbi:UNVERIFIED_CONTAM: hypothetical protein GTU68_040931 [Idotea baltica]|nr:hypothetical protein [Idotea baltica]
MIALVTRGDEVLLARSKNFPKNLYSTLAGFVEPGETVEQCVHREIYEEVGINVHNVTYLASQNWPYPHSLMLGFHVEYLSGNIQLQEEEIESARWFNLRSLPVLPPAYSIAFYLIESYIQKRKSS